MLLWLVFIVQVFSWKEVRIVTSQTQSCNNYKDCFNETLDFGSGDVGCYGSQSCSNCNLYNFSQVRCYGSSSCTDSTIKTIAGSEDNTYYSLIYCYGYGSCYNATRINAYDLLSCRGSLSCVNAGRISFDAFTDRAGGYCSGLYSCINALVQSDSSYSNYVVQRTFYFSSGGVLSLYNATIKSNHNKIIIRMQGYYGGYNSTTYCHVDDTCTMKCFGLGCLNTRTHAGDVNSPVYKVCFDEDDELCAVTMNTIVNDSFTYDYLATQMNTMLKDEYNFTLFPTNENDVQLISKFIDYSKSDICQIKKLRWNASYLEINKTISLINGSICCLAYRSCYEMTSVVAVNGDIYCNGAGSCMSTHNVTANNIYCKAQESCQGSTLIFKNIAHCEGNDACNDATIIGGKILITQ